MFQMFGHHLPYEAIGGLLVPISQNNDFISIPHKIWEAKRCIVLRLNSFVDGKYLHAHQFVWLSSMLLCK